MTTKASPPTTAVGNVKIKKEIQNDEIKDFAETAMNELLGWYGYDSVDRLDISTKASRLMHATNSIRKQNENKESERGGSTTSDHDTRSSREDSKSPNSAKTPSEKPEPNCGWCHRIVPENSPEFLTTPDGPRYCSESCFAQSRRASFKKAKTCDWCRHVRHAVSYVDFQDGASQLQFCSDKCLNQYKMQIFCKETQAHLDMNPHLKDKGLETTSGGGLITPDLWLKNCRSRSASPASTISVSPTPPTSAPRSPPPSVDVHKPFISVAPVAKLMSKGPGMLINRQSPKRSRRKRPVHNSAPVNSNSICNNNNNLVNSLNNQCANTKPKSLNSMTPSPSPGLSKSYHYPPNAQDLRLNSTQLSPNEGSQQTAANRPPHHFPPPFYHPSSSNFPPRPPLIPLSPHHQRFMGMPPPHHMPPEMSAFSSLFGATPPVTVMVPYPVIVPLPIPIPIPLPMMDFIKAASSQPVEEVEPKNDQSATQSTSSALDDSMLPPNQTAEPNPDQPLDFTKSKPDIATNAQTSPAPPTTSPEPKDENQDLDPTTESCDENQKLPKLKITRLHTKRLISSKESECSRPLRKRKRIIDCDYLRIAKEDEEAANAINTRQKK